jgi:transcriptional regulator with XRE-family HTH domain
MRSKRPTPATEELRERLGLNLRECRGRLGVSQYELSFRAETGLTAISPIELGRKVPRIDTFIRLAGALEVAPNTLASGILWKPAEAIVTPGGFEIPDDPEIQAEVEALREGPRPGRRPKR